VKIAASVASGDLARLAEMSIAVERAGADRIHLDIEDGVFVPTFTVGPAAVAPIRRAVRLPIDVHLQTVNPDRWIDAIAAGHPDRIIIHIEGAPHPLRTLDSIRRAGVSAGVALLLETSVDAVSEFLGHADHVTVMSADFPGAFSPSALDKVRVLAGRVPETIVDGGITPEILPEVAKAGATTAVVGRALFAGGPGGIAEAIAALRGAGGWRRERAGPGDP